MGKSALLFNFIKAYAIDGIEDCLEEVISAAVGWGKREERVDSCVMGNKLWGIAYYL
jgi:hypothetical protein